jgi:hypothetical protein
LGQAIGTGVQLRLNPLPAIKSDAYFVKLNSGSGRKKGFELPIPRLDCLLTRSNHGRLLNWPRGVAQLENLSVDLSASPAVTWVRLRAVNSFKVLQANCLFGELMSSRQIDVTVEIPENLALNWIDHWASLPDCNRNIQNSIFLASCRQDLRTACGLPYTPPPTA